MRPARVGQHQPTADEPRNQQVLHARAGVVHPTQARCHAENALDGVGRVTPYEQTYRTCQGLLKIRQVGAKRNMRVMREWLEPGALLRREIGQDDERRLHPLKQTATPAQHAQKVTAENGFHIRVTVSVLEQAASQVRQAIDRLESFDE